MKFEPSEEQFTFTEEEQLASVSSDRTLKLKHSELSLDAFWLLVKKESSTIAQKALCLLMQFSTFYLCEFGFSALTTIKVKKRAQLLSVEDELRVCLSKTRPNIKDLCKKHQAQVSHLIFNENKCNPFKLKLFNTCVITVEARFKLHMDVYNIFTVCLCIFL